jgi:hypothetical protein
MMALSRKYYLDEIRSCIAYIKSLTETSTQANLNDLPIILEDFVKDLLNFIFHIQLENLNTDKSNQPIIDLGDRTNRIAVQVTADNSRKKIQSTLDRFSEKRLYEEYSKLYIFNLKKKKTIGKIF